MKLSAADGVDITLTTPMASPFAFASGLSDCCTSNPESYKVLCEIENKMRLVLMSVPPGGEDVPHDHPAHSMYVLTDAKLAITPYGPDGKKAGEAGEATIPAGAAPIFPPGAHQVKNIGDSEVKVLFVECYPTCSPCGDVEGFASPFKVADKCYKILAEDSDMYTGMITIAPGETDGPVHHHKDHLCYVLSGDEVTIFPGGDMDAPMVVPIGAGAGIPAPMSAPPFAKHIVKNSGTKEIKMLFFEMKN
jgi:uncharacterized cupin superfamily protein